MSNIPSPGQIYRHFKGNLYRIVTLAQESETGEMLVIYQALYGRYQVYARPLSGFTERLDRRKYPEAGADFRFEPVRELVETPQVCVAGQTAAAEPSIREMPQKSTDVLSVLSAKGERQEEQESTPGTAEQGERRSSRTESREAQTDVSRQEIPRSREQEAVPEKKDGQKEWDVDPLLLEFLDARTYEERLKILSALQPRITDSMLNVMAIAADVEIRDGDTQERFDELRACLSTRQRYESRSSRLR